MKKIASLLFLCAIVFACKNDDDAGPTKPVDITLDDKATEFTDFKATDVGDGIDIDLKNADISISIRLEGNTSKTYDLLNLSGEGSLTLTNSLMVVTSLTGTPKVSKGGNVILTIDNGKLSGTVIADVVDPLEPDSTRVVIKGTFSNIDIANQSLSGCVVEKMSNYDSDIESQVNLEYRYDATGRLTEQRNVGGDGSISTRRIFSYLNGIAVETLEIGGAYSVFLMEYNGKNITRIREVLNNDITTSFAYNSERQITKITTSQKNDPTVTTCFSYSDGNVSRQADCTNPDYGLFTYTQFDDKQSPYSLLQSALDNQPALLYHLYPFGGNFSSNNVTAYFNDYGSEIATTYEYNAAGYPTQAVALTTTTTFTYGNCN